MDSNEIVRPPQYVLDYLNEYFEYEPDTGKIWRFFPTPQSYRLVEDTNSEFYGRVYLKNKEYRAHHICWFLYYGRWPIKEIDHKNRIRDDNRIDNLREVTDAEQTANLTTQSKYGRCIWYKKRLNKYEVCIRKNYDRIYVGVYNTPREAEIARDKAEGIGIQLELPL